MTTKNLFKKATKSNVKLRLALIGPSGSGKTFSALLIARGLVGPKGKIAVVDTENGTASLYVDRTGIGDFDIAEMSAPFLIDKYLKALDQAAEAEYDAVIIDSLTHAWSGEGGVLQRKEALDSRGGNGFANWAKMTPEQNALVNAVLQSKTHLIATMRSKTEYILTENSRGKQEPKKVGLAPIQRDGFEYEFDVCLEMAMDNTAKATKDRSSLFPFDRIFKPSNATGAELRAWLDSGPPPPPKEEPKIEFNEGPWPEALPETPPYKLPEVVKAGPEDYVVKSGFLSGKRLGNLETSVITRMVARFIEKAPANDDDRELFANGKLVLDDRTKPLSSTEASV